MSRFVDAIRRRRDSGRAALIAEIKARGSDGADLLRGRTAASVAEQYARGGAECLSVVTGRWFGGTPALLEEVARSSELPILCKDFIRSPADVAAAAERGASAILITLAVLPQVAVEAVLRACGAHRLDPFVEVSTAEELDRALALSVPLIAINNRDIQRREQTGEGIGRGLRLRSGRTDEVLWVSASGIDSPAAAGALIEGGFDALLVGTGLLVRDDLEAATRELAAVCDAPPAAPLLKVCGVSTEEEIEGLSSLSIDWLGLCLFPGASFSLAPDRARELARRCAGKSRPVLVTIDRDVEALARSIETVEPAVVQLSGFTRPSQVSALRERFPALTLIQVVHVSGDLVIERAQLAAYAEAGADLLLLDRLGAHGRPGSTGERIDDATLDSFRRDCLALPYLIAGGLDSTNVRERLLRSGAVGVDVCTGVRSDRGIDLERARAFVSAARGEQA